MTRFGEKREPVSFSSHRNSARPSTNCSTENITTIRESVAASPRTSIRHLGQELDDDMLTYI